MRIRVIEERCNGCGWCEHHCPVTVDARDGGKPAAAVVVMPGERRSLSVL